MAAVGEIDKVVVGKSKNCNKRQEGVSDDDEKLLDVGVCDEKRALVMFA